MNTTYPHDDSVIPLKYWEKFVSTKNFVLVQRAKTAQHLDVAFCADFSHCVMWKVVLKAIVFL